MHSDYAFRVLISLGLKPDEAATIQQIATAYGISKNHLMKVVQRLGHAGFIETLRGRSGGIRLARKPMEINLGQVIRATEEDFNLVECFDRERNTCVIAGSCRLKGMLKDALGAYFAVLDQHTLADILHKRSTPLLQQLSGPRSG